MYGSLGSLGTRVYASLVTMCIQLFRERLSEKSAKVHATIPKGTVGIFMKF